MGREIQSKLDASWQPSINLTYQVNHNVRCKNERQYETGSPFEVNIGSGKRDSLTDKSGLRFSEPRRPKIDKIPDIQ